MIDSKADLSSLISQFRGGQIPFEHLDAEVARLGERADSIADADLAATYAELELLFAEYTSGHATPQELWDELGSYANPITLVVPGRVQTYRTTFSTGAASVTSPFQSQVPAPSPVGGTRYEAVLA